MSASSHTSPHYFPTSSMFDATTTPASPLGLKLYASKRHAAPPRIHLSTEYRGNLFLSRRGDFAARACQFMHVNWNTHALALERIKKNMHPSAASATYPCRARSRDYLQEVTCALPSHS